MDHSENALCMQNASAVRNKKPILIHLRIFPAVHHCQQLEQQQDDNMHRTSLRFTSHPQKGQNSIGKAGAGAASLINTERRVRDVGIRWWLTGGAPQWGPPDNRIGREKQCCCRKDIHGVTCGLVNPNQLERAVKSVKRWVRLALISPVPVEFLNSR